MGRKEDNTLIQLIADRASRYSLTHGIHVGPEYIASELRVCHEEICPLRLQDLLDAELPHLMHDVYGIHQHMDILDGSFRECFQPRFAR